MAKERFTHHKPNLNIVHKDSMYYAVSIANSFLLLQASIWLSSALLLTFVFIYQGDNLLNVGFWH